MVEFLEYIYSQLASVTSRVYLEEAPGIDPISKEAPTFPYVVYNLPNSTEIDFREDFILEINAWDNSSDTLELENLTNEIDKKIQRTKYIGSNFFVRFYRINRMMIPDPNSNIRRRELRYIAKVYFF